jgi:hypothetical protein
MARLMTFRLPDDNLWTTNITPHTLVKHVKQYLGNFWRISETTIWIWNDALNLAPDTQIMSLVNKETDQDPILTVQIGTDPVSPRSATPEVAFDLDSIDASEQQRILERIKQKKVEENRNQARALWGRLRIGHKTRCIIGQINGTPLPLIVDTGASVSLLYMNLVESCSLEYLIDKSQECQVALRGIGDNIQNAIGVIHSVQLSIGSISTFGTFAVLPQVAEFGLLGIDWMMENGAIFRVADDSMEVHGQIIKFVDP